MPSVTIIPREKVEAIAQALPESHCAELLQVEKDLGLDCIFYATDLGVMMIPKKRANEIIKGA